MTAFRHILVPFDYSPPSNAALRMAGEIARAFSARLLVLHLVPIEIYGSVDSPLIAPHSISLETEQVRLESHVRATLGAPAPAFDVKASWGTPFLQIVDHAIECGADLIVMGTHGRTGLTRALLGSVAEKTVRLAPCPVLTVHEAANDPAVEGTTPDPRRVPGGLGHLMRQTPIVVCSTDTLETARTRMLEAECRHLPVVDGSCLVGIIADRDLQPYLGHLAHTRVNAVMSSDPTTVAIETSSSEAARTMLERRVRALPVVDGKRLVGMVTTSDILEDYVAAGSSRR
jgi:nucleotide-binding universal stress UspA family protein/CBS domain-containing protein